MRKKREEEEEEEEDICIHTKRKVFLVIADRLLCWRQVLTLTDKCGATMSAELTSNPFFHAPLQPNKSEQCVQALVALFVSRNFAAWKPPDVLQWLQVQRRIENQWKQ